MLEGSIMNHKNRKTSSGINHIATIISILCLVLLVVLFTIDKQQNKELMQELSQLAQQQDAEEQAFLDMVNAEYDADIAVINQYLPGIVCWGDSLTAGAGGDGTSYPKILQSLIQEHICDQYDLKSYLSSKYTYLMDSDDYVVNIPVVNMGVGGENTITILGRNGAIPYIVSKSFTIPADTTPVEIRFTSKEGQYVAPLRQGQAGVNTVTICGIEGTLSISQESYNSNDYNYYFTRSTAGELKTVPAGAEIITAASSQYLDYVTVIFIGQNGGYSDPEDLIRQQGAILDHQSANNDRFIIVGLHTGTKESRQTLEAAMEAEYGEKYINLREYMSTKAMTDAGLEPTAADSALMNQGATPYSLMVDDRLHFNAAAYKLIGNLIFDTMNDLGYFDEVHDTLTHNFDQMTH